MTNIKVIFDITITHLLTRIKQSGIAALGVTFGIGTFIILVSFMTGLNGLLDGLILDRTAHVRIYNQITPSEDQPIDLVEDFKNGLNIVKSIKPKSSLLRIHNANAILSTVTEDKQVKGVTPQASAQVFYLSGSIELNGVVNGINVQKELDLFNFGDYIVDGDPLDLLKINNGVLLGAGLAKKMSVGLGDKIQVTSPQGGLFALKVVGIYQSGLAEIDDVQSYVNLKTVQNVLGVGNNYITDLNIKLWDINNAPAFAQKVRSVFGVYAIDIQTANAQYETGTTIRNLITYAVSITLLIVAGFGIYNILNMLIYEKMNDIAILKATGFSGGDVRLIFIGQAMLIGIIGGALGLILGYGVSVLISHAPFETDALPTIKTYPVNFDPNFYLIGIVFALVSTFLAGYLPAQKAKGIDPVEVIRGQ